MGVLMGIDAGTSSLKVMIVGSKGQVLALCAESYEYDVPHPGFAQQDPDVWWKACCVCIEKSLKISGISPWEIQGIGFSGQMHGLVMLDHKGDSVRPAILHCDCRSVRQVAGIKNALDQKAMESILLNPVYTGFMLPSLLWVRENEQNNFKKIKKVCLPKDYLKFKLTGELSSDYSDASASLAYDVPQNRWSSHIFHTFALDSQLFVPVFPSTAVVGEVSSSGAKATGLCQGTAVVAGGGDAVMQGIGNGSADPCVVTINIGSSAQVCFQSKQAVVNPALTTHTFSGYEKGRWITTGAIMHGGLALKWSKNLFSKESYAQMDKQAALSPVGAGGVLFLPYLNGERTPYMNPDLSGAFLGCKMGTTQGDMCRAVMEGVVFALYQCMQVCVTLGLSAQKAVASGGGAKSLLWSQMQADVFGMPVQVGENHEQAALGAALASGVGTGLYQTVAQACEDGVRYEPYVREPVQEHHKKYQEYYALYKEGAQNNLSLLTTLGRSRQSEDSVG